MHPCSEGVTRTVVGPYHSKVSGDQMFNFPPHQSVLIFRAGVRVLALNSWERMCWVIFCLCSCLYLNMRVPSAVNQRL